MKNNILTARVNDDLKAEIEFIKHSLHLPSTTSVLTYAIRNLYQAIKEEDSQKTSFELFEEQGLLGCMEGPSDLSTNYKTAISEIIETKHSSQSRKTPRKHRTRKK